MSITRGSEASGLTAVDTQAWLIHPGTVGRPVFGKVHIVGEDGDELPAGEVGTTIYFSGGAGRYVYFNDPEKNRIFTQTRGAGAHWATSVTSMRTDLYICLTGARI